MKLIQKNLLFIKCVFIFTFVLLMFSTFMSLFSSPSQNSKVTDKTKMIYSYVNNKYVDKISEQKLKNDVLEFFNKYEKHYKEK